MAAELQPKSSGMIDADVSTINRGERDRLLLQDRWSSDRDPVRAPYVHGLPIPIVGPEGEVPIDWLSSEGTWHRPIHRPENGEDLRPVIVQEFVSLDGVMQAPGDPDEYPRGWPAATLHREDDWPLLSTR